MANLNKVMLIGNLTRDPEVRYTPSGKAVADIGLAVNRVWKNDQGQKQEETTFVDVTLWGSTAELAAKYLSKGRSCYIEGRLKLDTWDDKESGKKRSKLSVVGDTLQFIGDGKGAQGGSRPSADRGSDDEQSRPRSQGASPAAAQDFQEDDDIPF
jgi:single-strand DNA-binding protein